MDMMMTLERIIGYCNWIRYPHGSAIFLLNTLEFDCVLDLSWLNWLHMYMSQCTEYQVLFLLLFALKRHMNSLFFP